MYCLGKKNKNGELSAVSTEVMHIRGKAAFFFVVVVAVYAKVLNLKLYLFNFSKFSLTDYYLFFLNHYPVK